MKKLIALLLLFPLPALAQQTCPPTGPVATNAALLCWSNATQDVNGNPLPATGDGSLTRTRVQRSKATSLTAACAWNTVDNDVQNFDVTPDVTRMLFENLPAGKYCYRLRHSAQNSPDSDWTGVVTKNSVTPTPPKVRPPTITIY